MLFRSRAFRVTEHAHARADRTGRDEHHLAPRDALRRDLRDELFHLREIRLLAAVREDTGAELHDEAADIFEQFGTHDLMKVEIGPRKKEKAAR